MKGILNIRGRRTAPEYITIPMISIVDSRCDIVPPQAVIPFHLAVQSTDKKILWYKGDRGVSLQHVGMLVGKNAHRFLWPEIIKWVKSHENG